MNIHTCSPRGVEGQGVLFFTHSSLGSLNFEEKNRLSLNFTRFFNNSFGKTTCIFFQIALEEAKPPDPTHLCSWIVGSVSILKDEVYQMDCHSVFVEPNHSSLHI